MFNEEHRRLQGVSVLLESRPSRHNSHMDKSINTAQAENWQSNMGDALAGFEPCRLCLGDQI